MKPELVLACLTLCLLEAGSALKRRHLTTVLFGNPFRLARQLPGTSLIEGPTKSASHGTNSDVFPDSNQSAVTFDRSLTTSRDFTRDLLSILNHRHPNRAQFLRGVLRQVERQFKDTPLTSVMTKRQMMTSVAKRRSRYRCDLSRVTLQMILRYFRTRTLCGYRVTRMRFGLGGK